MELRKLIIPATFQEILKVYHNYKRLIFNVWCNMHYHELKIAKQSMMTQITSIAKSNDPQRAIKVCIGIRILGKIHSMRLDDLLRQLSNLLPIDQAEHSEFISFIIAKFCRRHYLKELKFITMQLARCNSWLHEDYPSPQVTCALQILHWFAQFASSAILSSSQQFFDALSVGQFHHSCDVRMRAYEIGVTFHERSLKGPLILSVFNQSLSLINSPETNEIHGSLLVLSNYARTHPNVISQKATALMTTCRFLMQYEELCVASAAVSLLVYLSPLDPVEFRNKHCEALSYFFFKDPTLPNGMANELISMMTHFPDLYIPFINNIAGFLPSLMNGDSNQVSSAFHIIKALADVFPNDFLKLCDTNEFCNIILNAPFNEDYYEIITPIFENHKILWTKFRNEVGNRLIKITTFLPVHLNIISKLQSLSYSQNEELYNLIHPLLNSSNLEIKSCTPAALFALNKDIHSESYAHLLNEVLSICVSESSHEVRRAFLKSIQPPFSPYLSYPEQLEFFSLLVNDNSFSVRREALYILGELSKSNPSMILPIFRRVLLDALFICDSSPLLRLQAQVTRSLTLIIKFADPILPVYIPVFIPIALNYLRLRFSHKENVNDSVLDAQLKEASCPFLCQHLPLSVSFHESQESSLSLSLIQRVSQQTVFEQKYAAFVTVNFIDTIALSCHKQKLLLEEKYIEITNLLLDILEQNTNKLIAVSCLRALTYILDYIGSETAIKEFPTLLTTIFNLGSKFTSSKIHSQIFKVYGRFGPIAPIDIMSIYDINSNQPNHSINTYSNNNANINSAQWTEAGYDKQINESEFLDASQIGSAISYSDWYLSISSSSLLYILEDPNLSSLHFQALKLLASWPLITSPSSQVFFNKFVRYLIIAIRTAPADEKEQYFPLIHAILKVDKEWMKPFANHFALLIEELMDSPFLQHALQLIPELVINLGDAFSPYLPKIITILLDTLFNTEMTQPRIAIKVLDALTKLSSFASDYVFIILRQMVEVVFNPMLKSEVVLAALQAMTKLVQNYDCSSYMSLLSRSVFQTIIHQEEYIRKASVSLLISLFPTTLYETYKQTALSLLSGCNMLTDEIEHIIKCENQEEIKNFLNENQNKLTNSMEPGFSYRSSLHENELVSRFSLSHSLRNPNLNSLSNYSVNENLLDSDNEGADINLENLSLPRRISSEKLSIDEDSLIKSALCDSSNFSPGQWKDWCRSFVLTSIKEAPSKIIQECSGIAYLCYGFAAKLFHSAFLSCWSKLSENGKKLICENLTLAVNDLGIPMYVLTTLVSLAEFMERTDQHLMISYESLAKAALRAEKLPFALFCIQKFEKLNSASIEALFRIYSQLAMEDDVQGLVYALRDLHRKDDFEITPKLAEQLGDWSTALRLYKENESHETFLSLLGSLSMLNDWNSLYDLYVHFDNLPATMKSESAKYFALAFFMMHDWDHFDQTIKHAPSNSVTAIILQCLANRSRNMSYNELIVQGFESLAINAGPLFPHGFSSLVPFIIQAEQLVELQEVSNLSWHSALESVTNSVGDLGSNFNMDIYNSERIPLSSSNMFLSSKLSDSSIGQESQKEELMKLQKKWLIRTRMANFTFFQIRPLIMTRIGILGEANAQNEILTLLKLARKSGELSLYDHYFRIYFPNFDVNTTNVYAIFQHCITLWKKQEKDKALNLLNELIDKRLNEFKPVSNTSNNTNNDFQTPSSNELAYFSETQLYIKALILKSKWIVREQKANDNEGETLLKAAETCQSVLEYSNKAKLFYSFTQLRLYNIREGDRATHAINAIQGLIHCALGISEMMQLSSLFFRAGRFKKVMNAVENDMMKLKLELWLPLIPQLFNQILNKNERLANFAQLTIRKALKKHHHLVIIPLLFAHEFVPGAKKICSDIITEFQRERPETYQNALIIYAGLLYACMTKTEQWLDALNTISELYKQGNIEEMKNIFEKMFSNLKTQKSDSDLLFNRIYAEKISAMAPAFRRFFTSKNRRHIESLWPEFRSLCTAMKSDIDGMSSIPTRFVAPLLSEVHDVDIAVPGTYDPTSINCNNINTNHSNNGSIYVNTIAKFASSMDVFPSKQRPKRFAIIGSDGREFWYLLKGHEDLRLDQSVVQLFSLINTFIPSTMPKIVTNFILPLSPSVGVIQWIPGSDTMFKLIREYRSSRGLPIDIEARSMISKSIQKFDNLRPIQRLEILREIAQETPDDALADILWLRSPNAETWVKRVSTFSKTSALMSIVGYIIGLGDRHPSNLMIHKYTGSVIHVDFGDCFEFARERVRFPELIPFRLTRFMVKALGPNGIDGSFRKTCLNTIGLVRSRREDVMSSLEIFAHAPMVNGGKSNLNLASAAPLTSTSTNSTNRSSSNKSAYANLFDEDEDEEDEEGVERVFSRICDKINGIDFETIQRPPTIQKLTQDEQVSELIRSATDMYNMAHLYHGWKPLW